MFYCIRAESENSPIIPHFACIGAVEFLCDPPFLLASSQSAYGGFACRNLQVEPFWEVLDQEPVSAQESLVYRIQDHSPDSCKRGFWA